MKENNKWRMKWEGGVVQQTTELLTGVHAACRDVHNIGALGHVLKTIDTFAEPCDRWTLPNAVKTGNRRLIERVLRFLSHFSTLSEELKTKQYSRAMVYAVAMGEHLLVQQLYRCKPEALDCQVAVVAAIMGDLPLLKWTYANKPMLFQDGVLWPEQVVCDVAAVKGDLETVQWLVTTFSDSAWLLGPAAFGGHIEVVKWLHQYANIDVAQVSNTWSVSGQLMLIDCYRIVEEFSEDIDKQILLVAQCNIRSFSTPLATDPMDFAAHSGNLDLLQWLHDNRDEGCSSLAAKLAAKRGNLEVILWLVENYNDQPLNRAIDYAALGGKLDMLQWLHTNHRDEGCTTNAMDWAAQEGHLEVIQWLNNNRTEGCTTFAVDLAARKGSLDVVKYLYANRSEGGTHLALKWAKEGKHNAVVRWFEEQNVELPVWRPRR